MTISVRAGQPYVVAGPRGSAAWADLPKNVQVIAEETTARTVYRGVRWETDFTSDTPLPIWGVTEAQAEHPRDYVAQSSSDDTLQARELPDQIAAADQAQKNALAKQIVVTADLADKSAKAAADAERSSTGLDWKTAGLILVVAWLVIRETGNHGG